MNDPMEAEFDDLAAWTAEAVDALGRDHAIPAASKGSASPGGLAWIGEALELVAGERVLDAGSGVGGPAAWYAARYGIRPVCLEPMIGAVRAGRRLFGLPGVVAGASRIPYAAGAFAAAWSLGVLCTVPDQPAMLAELRRVLEPAGRLALLVYVADGPVRDAPEGNRFPTPAGLDAMVRGAGFEIVDHLDGLPPSPRSWTERVERVEGEVERRHGREQAWAVAHDQSGRMGRLLAAGDVRPVVLTARR